MKIKFSVLTWLIFFSQLCMAQIQKFAVMQFDAGNDIKLVVINGFKVAECEKLISTFYSGLKMDCPQCKKDYGSCTNELDQFRPVWAKEKYTAPYVASGNLRYIKMGESRRDLEQWCQSTANRYKANGIDASCIN